MTPLFAEWRGPVAAGSLGPGVVHELFELSNA